MNHEHSSSPFPLLVRALISFCLLLSTASPLSADDDDRAEFLLSGLLEGRVKIVSGEFSAEIEYTPHGPVPRRSACEVKFSESCVLLRHDESYLQTKFVKCRQTEKAMDVRLVYRPSRFFRAVLGDYPTVEIMPPAARLPPLASPIDIRTLGLISDTELKSEGEVME